ncbi:MAG: thiol-disulfide oxidoreductase DCC family protein [Bacteroidota bacterium]
MKHDYPVVIFDGVCNLCNASVDFIIRQDKKGKIKVTANQHDAGQQILLENGLRPEQVETLYLLENGKLYDRSTAALGIARQLGFPWSLAYVFIVIPKPIRDGVYRWIARNRYRWFGKKDSCRLPTAEERAYFI